MTSPKVYKIGDKGMAIEPPTEEQIKASERHKARMKKKKKKNTFKFMIDKLMKKGKETNALRVIQKKSFIPEGQQLRENDKVLEDMYKKK